LFVKVPKFVQRILPCITWSKKNTKNNIWLTFDDGPTPEVTPFILNILKKVDLKATFFLVGEQIDRYPELFNQIINEGHKIANHSYSHINSWKSKNSVYLNDIEKCQKFMPENKLFRPPYGKITPLQIMRLKKKYQIILWDVLSWDFSLSISSEKVKQNVLKNTSEGSIIVFHNNEKSFNTLKVILEKTLIELKQKKFSFSITW
tara:strand:- start:1068 stop:1679 length:612 start_codon:yes stop_codon:yes gene_type:complete